MIVVSGKEFESLDQDIFINGKKVIEVYAGNKLVYPTKEIYEYSYAYWFVLPYAMTVIHETADIAGGMLHMETWVTPYRLAWNLIDASPSSNNVHCAMYVSFPGFKTVSGRIRYLPFSGYKGQIVAHADMPNSGMNAGIYCSSQEINGKNYYVTADVHLTFDTSGGTGGYVSAQNYKSIECANSKIFYDDAEGARNYVLR